MSIKLDWEIESDGGETRVDEDPAVLAARRRRMRRLRNLAIFLLIAGVIAIIVARNRLHRADWQRRAELEATVATETLALRMGGLETFRRLQADYGDWPAYQVEVFDRYQALGDRLEVSGAVVDLEIDANRAWIVLRETLDGEPYLVTWFYQYDQEEGWQHTPPITSLFGPVRYAETDHLDVFFRSQDEAFATMVAEQVEVLHAEACRLTGCEQPPRATLYIVTEPTLDVEWGTYGRWTLLVPSPMLSRVPERGLVEDPELTTALAEAVAWRWATLMLGDGVRSYSDAAWLRDEVAAWLVAEMGVAETGSAVLAALTENYGQELITAWLAHVRDGEPVLGTLAALTGVSLDVIPISWNSFFEHRLRTEVYLRSIAHTGEAEQLVDSEREGVIIDRETPFGIRVRSSTIEVFGVRQVGDIWWVEARARQLGAVGSEAAFTISEPFRLVDEDWYRTMPVLSDWQDPQQSCGEHICLNFSAPDAMAMDNLTSVLEETYMQAQADLSPALPDGDVAIWIVPSEEVVDMLAIEPTPGALRVTIISPHALGRVSASSPEEYILRESIRGMVYGLVEAATQPLPGDLPLVHAFANWEVARLIGESTPADPPETEVGEFVMPDMLQSETRPWQVSIADNDLFAQALLETLEELYGTEAMGPLLDALPVAPEATAWLEVVGGSPEEVVGPWGDNVSQALGVNP